MRNYLDFEKELKSLEDNLESSKNPFDKEGISEVDVKKIKKIQDEINEKLETICLSFFPHDHPSSHQACRKEKQICFILSLSSKINPFEVGA